MKKSLLISAAAMLIAGPAFAQGTQVPRAQAPERAPAAQQSAPAEKMAPASHHRTVPNRSASRMARRCRSVRHGRRTTRRRQDPETTGQGSSKAASQSDKAAQGRDTARQSDAQAPAAPPGRPTTGQGAASTSSSLTGEQRSKISTSIKQQNAPR